ncbi:MAG: DUF6602 domain-containing protein [Vicinamibacterales bacterium]
MQQMLLGVHAGGSSLSSASKGVEREAFVSGFLKEVLPPPFRFGIGDATDQSGARSGQLDVVIEFPLVPSLPMTSGGPRLYLAEGIVAVVEVKSNVASQWDEVAATARQLAVLNRVYGSGVSIGPRAGQKIPLYAVGYKGWSDFESLQNRLQAHPEVSGVLVLDSGHFMGRYDALTAEDKPYAFSYERKSSPMALWGLISCIHHAASMTTSKAKDVPRRYDEFDV